ncbi:unnamed protein product, partial [Ixodes hexagonus]
CDSGAAINAFFHAIYRKQQITMLLGTSSSEVTERLAKVVSHWGILQISFGSLGSVLSDRAGFPLFFRTVAPDSSHNAARVALIRRFQWDTVATLHEDDELYALAINELLTQLESANISVSASESVTRYDFLDQIHELKRSDCRIIIGSFSKRMARKIFCEVYRLGMYGADFQWIIQGGLGPWWQDASDTDCSVEELQAAARSLITVSAYTGTLPDHTSVSGLQMDDFRAELDTALKAETPGSLATYGGHVTEAYDAVWTVALALRAADQLWKKAGVNATLSDFRYEKLLPDNAGGRNGWNTTTEPPPKQIRRMANFFDKIVSQLRFNGIAGKHGGSHTVLRGAGNERMIICVSAAGWNANFVVKGRSRRVVATFLNKGALTKFRLQGPLSFFGSDRVGITEFQQNQGTLLRTVLLYDLTFSILMTNCILLGSAFFFLNNAPAIRKPFENFLKLFYSVQLLFHSYSIRFEKFLFAQLYCKVVKNSTTAKQSSTVSCNKVRVLCIPFLCACFWAVRAFLLSGGFSLAFGAIFIKTYRVHHIFIRASSGIIKNKLLQDQQLIALVCLLVLIDCAIVTLWVTFDPMERTLRNLTMQISKAERDVVYLPQREQCYSVHMVKWLGALYIYKGLLLVVGCYMAWETRNVQIPALNDSQYIGLSVYNAVITSALVVALANVISAERYTLTFALVGTLIFVSTTTTLCLLFLPKV